MNVFKKQKWKSFQKANFFHEKKTEKTFSKSEANIKANAVKAN